MEILQEDKILLRCIVSIFVNCFCVTNVSLKAIHSQFNFVMSAKPYEFFATTNNNNDLVLTVFL